MHPVQLPVLKDVSQELWDNLATQKIYFGHQSVGYNILDGVQEILTQNNFIQLNIVETENPQDFNRPILAHSRVGQNTDPISKITAFKNAVNSGIGDQADIAFFKFCYIDFNSHTDIQAVFSAYRSTLESLEKQYPKTIFIPVGVPLCSPPLESIDRIKGWVKGIIGKPTVLDDNRVRCRFNSILKETFSPKRNVLDLALYESVKPDGTQSATLVDGESVYSLIPEYTTDGGHLNAKGRQRVAEQFLIFLARTAVKPVVNG